jgi:hypothetical protein
MGCGSDMGRTAQNVYRQETDTPVKLSFVKSVGEEEYLTHIDPLLRLEDALISGAPLGVCVEGLA